MINITSLYLSISINPFIALQQGTKLVLISFIESKVPSLTPTELLARR